MIPPIYRSILLGAAIAFVWSFFSWSVLPWHQATFKQFKNEQAVAEVITENAPEEGLYTLPSQCYTDVSVSPQEKIQLEEKWEKGPIVFSVIRPHGVSPGMAKEITIHLFTCLIGAGAIAFLLCHMGKPLGYWHKVLFITLVAFAGGVLNQIPLWNWHAFSPAFIFVEIIDQLAAWFLAGIGMAAVLKTK